ncbi:hypothetical protein FKM82_021796 [Ascaphus truei]
MPLSVELQRSSKIIGSCLEGPCTDVSVSHTYYYFPPWGRWARLRIEGVRSFRDTDIDTVSLLCNFKRVISILGGVLHFAAVEICAVDV